ncbi:uncharacterized protein LOC132574055 [Heteronotia binoei]|uniref:uncharacterized protein LOC132574055 n=1 Tax=Heteronotia binoei TaxID=13085 RepID=UPI0029309028|nr:uncharacterized protein LOC132574055 [Heteronotia binoei]
MESLRFQCSFFPCNMVLPSSVCGKRCYSQFGDPPEQELSSPDKRQPQTDLPKPRCFSEMPAGQSFRKAKREIKEECTGDAKRCRKKNGHLLKKKLSTLNLFSGHSKDILPQERNLVFEEKKRELQRKNSKKLKAPLDDVCLLEKSPSEKMCPKCQILICKVCKMLHTDSSFIAHSLLDHYDKGRHSFCCSDSGTPQDHHDCKHSPGLDMSSWQIL